VKFVNNAYKLLIISLCFTLLLIGCNVQTPSEKTTNNRVELTKISTKQPIDQQASNQAKEMIRQYDAITSVKAINSSHYLVVAFVIEHLKRFKLERFRKNIQKHLEKQFPHLKVIVSTDQKIILELDQLENKIETTNISKKQLEEFVKKIIRLSKEQT